MFARIEVPATISAPRGAFGLTPLGWAIEDATTANDRMRMTEELIERVKAGTVSERMALRLPNMIRRARKAETHCTVSGMVRTECDTCQH
ncbi:hypothetical protein ACF1A5_11470 [Streptomyces sp. NPDC014864]|uniref:hypothetical protein n=1 Tax=Streptomyces sp. NPDC014864 TaxID=3364924 RepID=UPI0036FFF5D9